MESARLKEFHREIEGDHAYAIFELSEPPRAAWIVCFEECLAKHSRVAIVVSDRMIRTDLPAWREIPRLIQVVQRCIDETNLQEGC